MRAALHNIDWTAIGPHHALTVNLSQRSPLAEVMAELNGDNSK
jgi:hypothetical protein